MDYSERSYKKTPKEVAREEVFELLRKRGRPIRVGEAAMVLGSLWQLSEVEDFLNELVQEGVLQLKETGEGPLFSV